MIWTLTAPLNLRSNSKRPVNLIWRPSMKNTSATKCYTRMHSRWLPFGAVLTLEPRHTKKSTFQASHPSASIKCINLMLTLCHTPYLVQQKRDWCPHQNRIRHTQVRPQCVEPASKLRELQLHQTQATHGGRLWPTLFWKGCISAEEFLIDG